MLDSEEPAKDSAVPRKENTASSSEPGSITTTRRDCCRSLQHGAWDCQRAVQRIRTL